MRVQWLNSPQSLKTATQPESLARADPIEETKECRWVWEMLVSWNLSPHIVRSRKGIHLQSVPSDRMTFSCLMVVSRT